MSSLALTLWLKGRRRPVPYTPYSEVVIGPDLARSERWCGFNKAAKLLGCVRTGDSIRLFVVRIAGPTQVTLWLSRDRNGD